MKLICKVAFIIYISLITYSIKAGPIDSLKQVLLSGNENEKKSALHEIGKYYQSEFGDSSFVYFEKILGSKFSEIKDLSDIYYSVGKVCMENKNFERAYLNLMQALKLYSNQQNEKGIAYCKYDLALVYSKFYEYQSAMDYIMEAIGYFRQKDLPYNEAEAMLRLGDFFNELEKYDNAIEVYKSSLVILKELDDSSKIAGATFKIAQAYGNNGNLDMAISNFNKCLAIFEKSGNQIDIANTYFEIASLYSKMDQFDKADVLFEKAIKIFDKIHDIDGSAKSYLALAEYYLSVDDKNKALYYLNEALIAADFINSKELLLEIYQNMSFLYEKEQVYDKAFFYYKNYANLKDSLSSATMSYKFSQIKSFSDNQTKNETIRKLVTDSYFKDQAIKKQAYIIVIGAFAGILVIIFISILFIQDRRRKKTNKELIEKNLSLRSAENKLILINEEIQKSENRLKGIIQNMPVLVSASDSEDFFIFWNNACELVTGYSANEILNNKQVAKEMMEKAKILTESHLQRENGVLHCIEYEIETKSGEKRDILWTSMSEVFPIEGWHDWHVGIDVTDRNLFAQSLERETAILNSILDSIPHPIFYKDKDGRYQKANQGFYKLHEVSDEKLLGKKDSEIFSKEESDYFQSTDSIIFKNHAPYKESRWLKSSNNEEHWFDTIKTPLFDSSGRIIGIVGISFDLTERYQIEQELKKQKEKAEETDRLKSAFLANMSHEIRSPMNAIIGFSNLVADSFELNSEIGTYMDYIRQSGTNLLQLLDDIIDIAKIEAGQIKIRKEKFDLDEMLQKTKIAIETSTLKSKKSKIPIHLNIPQDSEKPVIISDELRIRQVLNNFLTNALKFTDEGIIEFGYEKLTNNELLFYTKDTGIGIAESDKHIIFDRFGQVHEMYTRNTSGTGLGLAISKSIVEMLDGEIWFDSLEGKGSTFYFKIPVEYTAQKPEKIPEPLYKLQDYNWEGKKLLVVEDDEMNFKVLTSILQNTGATIVRAENGMEAVEIALSGEKIDIILMDIQLPLLNGYDASKQIKAEKDIPIVAITAYSMPGEKEKSIDAGCIYFITKPFNRFELLYKISVSFKET